MSVCTLPELANFVSDCADIVCASDLMANYFLSAMMSTMSGSLPRVAFSKELVGTHLPCGSVDLSSWLRSVPTALASDTAAQRANEAWSVATALPLISASSIAAPEPTPSHMWRPIVLAALSTVLLVFLVADVFLLSFVQRKRMAMQAQRPEEDHCPA
ncbi:hypothetical protein ABL78_0614 [Leptomonas seymouri]|uniref:Transmembrane protein n=1 Tax=Leptomonas seymouri TaxID=5684 RepID=A0A0N1I3C0_LEPSE|nr:hypothetical protein ABL78_0614 [Leptomonas seymouri]|eukprot:KPI90232.1 hypothetical protein ABL78_0614 [Leptomonas seymouri]